MYPNISVAHAKGTQTANKNVLKLTGCRLVASDILDQDKSRDLEIQALGNMDSFECTYGRVLGVLAVDRKGFYEIHKVDGSLYLHFFCLSSSLLPRHLP